MDGSGSSIASGPTETASGSGGTTRIRAQSISLTHRGNIAVGTLGAGNGGSLFIHAKDLFMRGNGTVGSGGIFAGATQTSTGNGGNVTIIADRVHMLRAATLNVETASIGRGGTLDLTAHELAMSGLGTVVRATSTGLSNGGPGGNLRMTVQSIQLRDNATILAGTVGSGAGGSARINAKSVSVDGAASSIFVGTVGPQNGGPAGRLDLITDSLHLTNGGQIFGGTLGSGRGGDVSISARSILIHRGLAGIYVSSNAEENGGDAGTLTLKTNTLKLMGAGVILAGTLGDGNGGAIFMDAGRVYLRGTPEDVPESSSTIIAVGSQGAGKGGRLKLRAGELRLVRGAAIVVGTSGSGNGGDTAIIAADITLDQAGIIAASDGGEADDGIAGSISLSARRAISLRNGSTVAASADVADGGSVFASAPRIVVHNSTMNARAGGAGGSVRLAADRIIRLFRSEINATGTGSIGDIVIDPQFVVLDHSRLVTSTQGQGGNVIIRTDRYFTSADSSITLAAGAVLNISVFNPDSDIAGQLVPVDAHLFDRQMTFSEQCARRLELTTSTFTIQGRSASSPDPAGLVPAIR